MQNTVGTDVYGLYFALFNFSILFQIILDFGINNFNNRAVAQNQDFISRNLSDILTLKLLLAAAYAAITIFCAFVLNYSTEQIVLLALLTAGQVLSSFILYLRSNLSGLHYFKTDGLLSVLDKLLMIILCGFLLWGPWRQEFNIRWFVYAQLISLLLTLIVTFSLVAYHVVLKFPRWNFSGIKSIMQRTYPYALLGLMMAVYYRIDGVMLERMLPDDGTFEAGVYAASYRLLDAVNMLGYLFASLLLPMFARLLSEKKEVHELSANAMKTILAVAVFTTAISFNYRHEIISLLYHHSTEYWADVFGILMPAFIGVCTVYIYGSLLTANGSMKALNSIAISGMLFNIALNYFLIPEYKALGATFATLITQTFVAIAHVYAVKKILPFTFSSGPFFRFLLFTAGCGFSITVTYYFSDFKLLNLAAGISGGLILLFFLKIVALKDVMGLLKKEVT